MIEIKEFTNDASGWPLVQQFVRFHRDFYQGDAQYVPLLDYEYLGSRLLSMVGYLEPRNSFFRTGGRARFFMAFRDGKCVGRVNAFVNPRHNEYWKDQVGFFGNFEAENNPETVRALLEACRSWLKAQGMDTMRGPQNFPINEATPGVLTEGFDSRPVVYYHYNKPYYGQVLESYGLKALKKFLSWEIPVKTAQASIDENAGRLAQKIVERYDVTFETWKDRKLSERKAEMFEIYNDAWSDNFGFVPFLREEFYKIIDDMALVMRPELFLFLYVKGEPAAFFGAVPNIFEIMPPKGITAKSEFARAVNLLLSKGKIKGVRLGYLGVKKKFRRLGLDAVMLWKENQIARDFGLQYCDMGWVLEDNILTVRLVERIGAQPSKKYTLFEMKIS
ncbi:MAG: hypothetical protein ACXWPM_12035 [Bdellovibrionota bacterium]